MQEPIIESDPRDRLRFDSTLVIVGGGVVNPAVLQDLKAAGGRFVAADGGAEECARAGVMPEAIIGDMDSLHDRHVWESRAKILPVTEQITTDFEKCLYMTEAPVTVALGMTGKRFDHTLAALDAVMRHAASRWVVLVDENDLVLGVSGDFSFEVAPGERVSIHPVAPVTFALSEGLRYPLDGLTLAPGGRLGTSNEAVAGTFAVRVTDGETAPWLLIVGRENLGRLVERLDRH